MPTSSPRIRVPPTLQALPDRCAPVAAWYVLRHAGKVVRIRTLLERLRWTPGSGVHGLGLAFALASYGLDVEISGDPDPDPTAAETELRHEAELRGVRFAPARTLDDLISRVESGDESSILLFRANSSDPLGHFAVIRGEELGYVLLFDSAGKTFRTRSSLDEARRSHGMYQQAITCRLPRPL